jgi:hypothetical protein
VDCEIASSRVGADLDQRDARDETELAGFYRKRFRTELRPAFEAWVATRPWMNPGAPLSPFAMSQYDLAATAKANRLEAQAAAASEDVGRFIQRADNYSLAVVLFAASLFFARHQHAAPLGSDTDGRSRPRLCRIPRQLDLDCDVSGQPVLVEIRAHRSVTPIG